MTAIVSQGMPTVPTFVVAEQGEKNIKKLNEAKKSLLKVLEKKFPDVERLYSVTNSQVKLNLLKIIIGYLTFNLRLSIILESYI